MALPHGKIHFKPQVPLNSRDALWLRARPLCPQTRLRLLPAPAVRRGGQIKCMTSVLRKTERGRYSKLEDSLVFLSFYCLSREAGNIVLERILSLPEPSDLEDVPACLRVTACNYRLQGFYFFNLHQKQLVLAVAGAGSRDSRVAVTLRVSSCPLPGRDCILLDYFINPFNYFITLLLSD